MLNEISFLVYNDDIFNDLLNELNSDNDKANELIKADLKFFNRQLKKSYDKRSKLDNDSEKDPLFIKIEDLFISPQL